MGAEVRGFKGRWGGEVKKNKKRPYACQTDPQGSLGGERRGPEETRARGRLERGPGVS